MAGTLHGAVLDVLRSVREVELYEFMDRLFRYCWDNGVICLRWVITVENGRIKRFCTDAWRIIESLVRKGVVKIKTVDNKTIIEYRGG